MLQSSPSPYLGDIYMKTTTTTLTLTVLALFLLSPAAAAGGASTTLPDGYSLAAYDGPADLRYGNETLAGLTVHTWESASGGPVGYTASNGTHNLTGALYVPGDVNLSALETLLQFRLDALSRSIAGFDGDVNGLQSSIDALFVALDVLSSDIGELPAVVASAVVSESPAPDTTSADAAAANARIAADRSALAANLSIASLAVVIVAFVAAGLLHARLSSGASAAPSGEVQVIRPPSNVAADPEE